ncbi:MAG: UbiH/UbiF family hydroxylase [Microvirga sp.]
MARQTIAIAVVGAGATGIAAAIAFARDGFRTVLVGRPETRADGRTVALMNGSVVFLEALGLWPAIGPHAAALKTLRIIDDTASLFRPPPLAFDAAEIGLDAFGWNLENGRLVAELAEAARGQPDLTLVETSALRCDPTETGARLHLQDGSIIETDLVVAADGRRSGLRDAAGIAARTWAYPQSALTTILAHDRDHRETSTEFHTRQGPFTLVPLPDRRSSLVWVTSPQDAQRLADLDDDALALAIERQAKSLLGRMRVAGPRGVVPMSGLSVARFRAPRLALIGEAAHVFPPIGAQGLNLGFRDAAALRDVVVDARRQGRAVGSEDALAIYQRGRDFDVRLRTAAVDGLNRTLLADLLPADFLRGAGLLALGLVGPLRRGLMREGVLPRIGAPRLMRRPAMLS